MPRFAVLLHETPSDYVRPTHYDVLLEDGDALITFAAPLEPTNKHAQLVERLADHRIEWLTLEGPLRGGKGTARRIDDGTFEWIERGDKQWRARLVGRSLKGILRFDRIASDAAVTVIGDHPSETETNGHGPHADPTKVEPPSAERWMMRYLPD